MASSDEGLTGEGDTRGSRAARGETYDKSNVTRGGPDSLESQGRSEIEPRRRQEDEGREEASDRGGRSQGLV